jgi:hypothetical protein
MLNWAWGQLYFDVFMANLREVKELVLEKNSTAKKNTILGKQTRFYITCRKCALRSLIHSLNLSLVSEAIVETVPSVLLKTQNLTFCFYHHLCGLLSYPFSLQKKSKIKIPTVRSGDRCGHILQRIMWSQRNPHIISHVEHNFFFSNPQQGPGDRYNSTLDVCPNKMAKGRVCMHFGWRGCYIMTLFVRWWSHSRHYSYEISSVHIQGCYKRNRHFQSYVGSKPLA